IYYYQYLQSLLKYQWKPACPSWSSSRICLSVLLNFDQTVRSERYVGRAKYLLAAVVFHRLRYPEQEGVDSLKVRLQKRKILCSSFLLFIFEFNPDNIISL